MCAKRYEFYDPKLSEEYANTGEGFFQKYFGCSRSSFLGYSARLGIPVSTVFANKGLFNIMRFRGQNKDGDKISPLMFEKGIVMQFAKILEEREQMIVKIKSLEETQNTCTNCEYLTDELEATQLTLTVVQGKLYEYEKAAKEVYDSEGVSEESVPADDKDDITVAQPKEASHEEMESWFDW